MMAKYKVLTLISLILLGWLGFADANPEAITFNSALVWRQDVTGDYLLPDLKNGVSELSIPIYTTGQIKSITANWQFIGKVTLEVSADSGLHYTRVVNGVPLVSGFVSDNRLKWRATALSEDAKLSEVKIVYTDTSGVMGSFGQPGLSGFGLRKSVYLKGCDSGELFNYQIQIKVGESETAEGYDLYCAGGIRPDFKDVRFTAPDGETLLPYYLEGVTGTSPNQVAYFWVKVPEIPVEGIRIYFYYGNSEAEDLSRPKETFDIFDDFQGLDLDKEQWEMAIENGGSYSLADGWLTLNKAEIKYKAAVTQDGIMENKTRDSQGKEVISSDKEGLKTGYVGLAAQGVASYDWIRVRRAIFDDAGQEIKPGVDSLKTLSAKEEPVDLPVFRGITLAKNGNLVLAPADSAGTYVSKKIPSPLPVRIIVPKWETQDKGGIISVDISADNGKTYKNDCQPDVYYYASKTDFMPGNNLKYQINFLRSQESGPQLQEMTLDYRPGNILLISPNGGESWAAGTEKEIAWTAMEYEPTYPLLLEYSLDNGKTYKTIAKKENSGSFFWPVPREESEQALIRISDAYSPEIFAVSLNSFKIIVAKEFNDYRGKGEGVWSNPKNWKDKKVPDLNTEVTIANGTIVETDQEISFRSLTLGDGKGKQTTTLVLKHQINPKSGEIIVLRGGKLIQGVSAPLSIAGNLTIKSGGILTHSPGHVLNLAAQSVIIEPKARVEADGKYGSDGGLIRLDAQGDFSIFGMISANGAGKAGGKGGTIDLSANTFAGEGAEVYAQGGSSPTQGGSGGDIYVKGEGGGIKGTVNVNGGEGPEKGAAGSVVFE